KQTAAMCRDRSVGTAAPSHGDDRPAPHTRLGGPCRARFPPALRIAAPASAKLLVLVEQTLPLVLVLHKRGRLCCEGQPPPPEVAATCTSRAESRAGER